MSIAKIVVMLIWGGSGYGNPTSIPGFNTIEACNAAKPMIIKGYQELSKGVNWYDAVEAKCVEMER